MQNSEKFYIIIAMRTRKMKYAVLSLLINLTFLPVKAEETVLLEKELRQYVMTSAAQLKEEVLTARFPEMTEDDITDSVFDMEDLDATVHTPQLVKIKYRPSINGSLTLTEETTEAMVTFIGEEAPVIELKETELSLSVGSEFDPYEYIESITDDSGIEPMLKVDGEVDTDTAGTYTITYSALDSQALLSEAELTVKVCKPLPKRRALAQNGGWNPYSGGWSNCTWSAWELARSHTGLCLPQWGNASSWYYGAAASGYTVSSTPSPYCIAVYSGHVALVTAVSGNSVYIKEGGYLGGYNERWVSAWGTGTRGLIGYIWLH